MTRALRVGIDLDGVCYDFIASLRAYLRVHGFPVHRCTEPQRWEFYLDWGLTLEGFKNVCNMGVDRGIIFRHGEPFTGTRDALQSMRDAGHTIHVVTDRNWGTGGNAEQATRAWLDQYGIPFDSLTFSADKTIARVDVMVDDKSENYDALNAAGVDAWLLSRPWNQAHLAENRIASLADFAEIVNNYHA